MRGRWLVLLLLPPCAAAATDAPPLDQAGTVIRQCWLQSRPDAHGLAELKAACPRIEDAAAQLQLDPLLPADWKSRVDAFALADLSAIAGRYAGPAPGALPDAAGLRAIARSLEPKAAPASWWERLLAWLRQRLLSSGAAWPSWLNLNWHWHWPWHWRPGVRFWSLTAYALAAGIVVAAIAVVALEVRAARLPGGTHGRRRLRRKPLATPTAVDGAPGMTDIEAAPAAERPVLALRLLVGALTRSRRLVRDRNLTCRELVAAARFDDEAQRDEFRGIAMLAERALYGGQAAGATAAHGPGESPSTDAIRTLYQALLATPHPPRAAP